MNDKLSPSEYAVIIEAWQETWKTLSSTEKSQLVTEMGNDLHRDSSDLDCSVYDELYGWYIDELRMEEREEEGYDYDNDYDIARDLELQYPDK